MNAPAERPSSSSFVCRRSTYALHRNRDIKALIFCTRDANSSTSAHGTLRRRHRDGYAFWPRLFQGRGDPIASVECPALRARGVARRRAHFRSQPQNSIFLTKRWPGLADSDGDRPRQSERDQMRTSQEAIHAQRSLAGDEYASPSIDRLKAAEALNDIQEDMLGHVHQYGKGTTLEHRHRWLTKIAYTHPTRV